MRLASAVWLLLSIGGLCACDQKPETASFPHTGKWSYAEILSATADLGSLAAIKSPLGSSRLFSSSAAGDKTTLIGFSPKTYGDFDHGSFLRVEEVSGGVQGVMAEVEGAGVISWIWSANPAGDLVIEIDGKETVYPFEAFLRGKWLAVRNPFSSETAEGYNLHFPLIHAHSCRISVRAASRAELGSLFYQVAWNALETDGMVIPFTLAQGMENKKALQTLADTWLHPAGRALENVFDGEVVPGASCEAVVLEGAGSMETVQISARSKEELATLYVELLWDGESAPSLACPLYMLCGTSASMDDVQSIPITVDGAVAEIRWPMPFEQGAVIRLINTGTQAARLRVSAARSDTCESGVRFLGNYYHGRPVGHVELAGIQGPGQMVGCIVDIENHGKEWWGEGDPLIWLDAINRPAWRGTGSEDYFGCAWCSPVSFEHPLGGQLCKVPSRSVLSRYHLLDTLPFSHFARFQFEVVGQDPGLVDYSTLVLWYSDIRSMKDVMDSM